ncbi:MAG: CDP-alcohol phosphatidyltransferase family protein [bacterium]
MNKLTVPNLLSSTRLFAAPFAFYFILHTEWIVAAIILIAAIVTDILDGYLARRWHQTSSFGGLIDHGSDAILVTTMLAAEVSLGLVPLILPILVILAFTQYTLDSKALAGQPLRASVLGRYNGILYFVLAGFPIMQQALGIFLLPDEAFWYGGWILVVSTSISMAERLATLLRLEHEEADRE